MKGQENCGKSANMPLREFLYSAEEYAKWINRNKKDLFGEKMKHFIEGEGELW